MRFTINTTELAGVCSELFKVVSPKSLTKILECIKVSAKLDEKGVTFLAGSPEISLAFYVDTVTITETGEFCVNAKEMLSIAKSLPKGIPVTIGTEDTRLSVTYDGGKVEITIYNDAEYPEPHKEDSEAHIMFTQDKLRLVEYVGYAAAVDTTRPVMCGTCFFKENGRLAMAASDTHKLAVLTTECDMEIPDDAQVILPVAATSRLGLFAKTNSDVLMSVSRTGITLTSGTCGNIRMWVPRLVGHYPNVRRVIPDSHVGTLSCSRKDVLAALERVKVCAPSHSDVFIVEADPYGTKFKARDYDYGRMAETRLVCEYRGPEMRIGLNHIFFAEVVKHMPGDDIEILLDDESRPIRVMTATAPGDYELTAIQMPMQIV